MIDFLRANPWCSQEQYKWGMTIPQVRLASMDFSHVAYLSEREKKLNKHKPKKGHNLFDPKNMTDVGIPIINSKK